MKIKWLGHASFLITSEKGLKILTDPYEPNYRDIISYAPIAESPDIVTVSHEHGDHYCTATLKGSFQVLKGAGKQTAKGIEFTGTHCYHDRVSGKERGENIIFTFSVDSLRICHTGDLGHPLDDATLRSLGKVDILLIPTGGPMATLDLTEAISLWDKLKPSVVIPMHFKNDRCNFPKYTIDDLIRLKPEAVSAGKTEIEFTAGKLPKSQILILNHAL